VIVRTAAALVVFFMAGCASPSDPDDGRIYLEVRNRTDRPIHGVLVAPPLVVGQPVSIAPGETREWWIPRNWFPKKVIFVVESKE
jgi:hypothetical protein